MELHAIIEAVRLLIVPYGIETSYKELNDKSGILLIVPYGIETSYHQQSIFPPPTFNRTLWN